MPRPRSADGRGPARPAGRAASSARARRAATRPGWSAARCRCPAARVGGAPTSSSPPAPSAGRGRRPTPRRRRRHRGAGRRAAARGRRASRSASSQLGQAIINQASGTRNGTPSSVGPRCRCRVLAVREPGGQPDRLERHRVRRHQHEQPDRRPRAAAASSGVTTERTAPSSTIVHGHGVAARPGGQRIGDRGQPTRTARQAERRTAHRGPPGGDSAGVPAQSRGRPPGRGGPGAAEGAPVGQQHPGRRPARSCPTPRRRDAWRRRPGRGRAGRAPVARERRRRPEAEHAGQPHLHVHDVATRQRQFALQLQGCLTYSRCTESAKPGANRSTAAISRRASLSARASQSAPSASAYGYHCPQIVTTCRPGGARVSSLAEKHIASGTGERGSRPAPQSPCAAASSARSVHGWSPDSARSEGRPGIGRQRVGERPDDEAEPVAQRRVGVGERRRGGVPGQRPRDADVARGDDGVRADPPSGDGLDPGDPAVLLDQQPGGAVPEHHPAAVGLQPAPQRGGRARRNRRPGDPAGRRAAGRPGDHRRGARLGHRRPDWAPNQASAALSRSLLNQRSSRASPEPRKSTARSPPGCGPAVRRGTHRPERPDQPGRVRAPAERGGHGPAARPRPRRTGGRRRRPPARRRRRSRRRWRPGRRRRRGGRPSGPSSPGDGAGRNPTGRSRGSAARARRGPAPRRCRSAG